MYRISERVSHLHDASENLVQKTKHKVQLKQPVHLSEVACFPLPLLQRMMEGISVTKRHQKGEEMRVRMGRGGERRARGWNKRKDG